MKSILLIEDEERVSEVIRAYLEREGFRVFSAHKGLEGLEIFKNNNIKLVILDLMLPDIAGEEVCRRIREASEVYIFMLTAKGSLEDKIQGLNVGADEYLVKPFSPRELVARVKSLFRRLEKEETSFLSFNNGELMIDYDNRTVKLKGKDIAFTPNELDILYTLASNKGRVLSREQLIAKVFNLDFDGYDRTIDVHIKNIRKKIEDDSRNPKYILTVTKAGYKFGGDS